MLEFLVEHTWLAALLKLLLLLMGFVMPLASLSTLDDVLSRLAAAHNDNAGDAVAKAATSAPERR